MVKINRFYDLLPETYLFQEVNRRVKTFKAANPDVEIFRLGVGNTTEPLKPITADGLARGVQKLRDVKTYSGYGDEQGNEALRKAIAQYYNERQVTIDPLEVFVSDGAKCDTANLSSIFDIGSIVAVQDPVYPVYVDTNVIAGRGGRNIHGRHMGILYMPCTPENNFAPSLPGLHADLIYLCSPNNPTGTALNKEQLKVFVDYARAQKSVIIFDAAYEAFIRTPGIPHTIYEVEGSEECTIEVNSFSKSAGFTGVRLGWSVVPKKLVVEDGGPGKINALWNRRQTTFFNGASNVAQEGGLAVLTEEGQREVKELVDFYMGNANIIRRGLVRTGFEVYGGVDAPYLWMKTPQEMKSWDFFDKLLQETHVVGTPGVGFGSEGEGYFRFSGFQHRDIVERAVESIQNKLRL